MKLQAKSERSVKAQGATQALLIPFSLRLARSHQGTNAERFRIIGYVRRIRHAPQGMSASGPGRSCGLARLEGSGCLNTNGAGILSVVYFWGRVFEESPCALAPPP
jgi:hypothetical protein